MAHAAIASNAAAALRVQRLQLPGAASSVQCVRGRDVGLLKIN